MFRIQYLYVERSTLAARPARRCFWRSTAARGTLLLSIATAVDQPASIFGG
jgi:hypothetical protein